MIGKLRQTNGGTLAATFSLLLLALHVAVASLVTSDGFLSPDSTGYLALARNMLDGHGYCLMELQHRGGFAHFSTQPPLYAAGIAAVGAILPHNAIAIFAASKIFNVICAAATIWMLARALPKQGWRAGLLLLAMPFLSLFTFTWSEALFIPLMIAFAISFDRLRAGTEPASGTAILAGLISCALIATRYVGIFALLVLAFAAAVAFLCRDKRRGILAASAAMMGGVALASIAMWNRHGGGLAGNRAAAPESLMDSDHAGRPRPSRCDGPDGARTWNVETDRPGADDRRNRSRGGRSRRRGSSAVPDIFSGDDVHSSPHHGHRGCHLSGVHYRASLRRAIRCARLSASWPRCVLPVRGPRVLRRARVSFRCVAGFSPLVDCDHRDRFFDGVASLSARQCAAFLSAGMRRILRQYESVPPQAIVAFGDMHLRYLRPDLDSVSPLDPPHAMQPETMAAFLERIKSSPAGHVVIEMRPPSEMATEDRAAFMRQHEGERFVVIR